MRLALPIDAVVPDVLRLLREHGAVVLEAPPGSGKTTRVPIALCHDVEGQVWVLQPRRVAARAAAQRVASELGEPVGETVGYAMRLDRRESQHTRVLYVTEALLTRRLDDFDGIGAVVLDEFHERSIHTDVALAWCRMLRRTRPALRIVVMSATLDGEAIAGFLGCPRVRAEGTLHPVEVRYLDRKDERPLEQRVAAAVRSLAGDVLAFLPGVGEIERTAALLTDFEVLPLHGELDGAAQDRALRAGVRAEGGPRRVVLATNVAETSVTVEGIGAVVDCGLVRRPAYDAWSGLPTLDLVPIARDAAVQRAGRAGRLGPGTCLRMYSRADFDRRPPQTPAEIKRIDLAATVLALGGRDLEWFEAPPAGAWKAAIALLERMGALAEGRRTALGDRMATLPLPPRLARVLLEAAALGVPREGARLVTLFGRKLGGDLVERALDGEGDAREARRLEALVDGDGGRRVLGPEAALRRACLAGFPDRVARREGGRVRFAEGGAAESDVGRDGYVVVTEVDRVGTRVRARTVTPVDDDWLVDRAVVRATLRWAGERVEAREELCFGELVLDASVGTGDRDAVATMLFEHARPTMHKLVPDWARGLALLQRVGFLCRRGVALPTLELETAARSLCEGRRSFDDLGTASLVAAVLGALSDGSVVDRLAPETVRLPGRPRALVSYDADEPYLESRMQDFFGLGDGPRVADGYAVVLHLLAPNHRPVQVTRDLAGFWQRHYPAIRKELMRRYPRHAWPEDPRVATPRAPAPR
ncbi:MAG: DEAD/DEAH box helicase [Myxococcales bacterium]|nr:DEAD/DEAH box helicase [Myxococcales bacterium]